MCMQSTPTATLDLSVMIPGADAVATLMWSVVSWDTQEETPTRIPTGALFQVTLPWMMWTAGETRGTFRSALITLVKTVRATKGLECIVIVKNKIVFR